MSNIFKIVDRKCHTKTTFFTVPTEVCKWTFEVNNLVSHNEGMFLDISVQKNKKFIDSFFFEKLERAPSDKST